MKLNKKVQQTIFRILLCVVGSFLLAFGTAVFLTPANIVAGGVSGVGIIINYYVEPLLNFSVIDIVAWSINIFMFILSFIFLGKKFTLHTLISTFLYPAFLTLMIRTGMFNHLASYFDAKGVDFNELHALLAGIFGGLIVGLGVSITFFGDGSTGGFDVVCFIVYKYLHIKQSLTSFIIDGTIILISAVALPNNIIPACIGILSALIAAIVIDVVYVQTSSAYVVDIISSKHKEINAFIVKELGRTTTMIDVTGAFSNKKFKLLRFVIDRRLFQEVKEEIAILDPKAFVTVYNSSLILGEGFLPIKSHRRHHNGK